MYHQKKSSHTLQIFVGILKLPRIFVQMRDENLRETVPCNRWNATFLGMVVSETDHDANAHKNGVTE